MEPTVTRAEVRKRAGRRALAFFAGAAMSLAFAGFSCARAADAIKIGLAAPLSGAQKELGLDIRLGAEAAIKAVNDEGGLLGRPLELVAQDDRCNARQATVVAMDFVRQDIGYVIGHACSGASIPASLIYQEDGVIMVTPSSTSPVLTERGLSNVFRVAGKDDDEMERLANFVTKYYRNKKIAIIHNDGSYGKGLANIFKDEINRKNIKEVLYESLDASTQDLSKLIGLLIDSQVELLFFGGYYSEFVALVRQSYGANFRPVFVTGEAASRATFISEAGPGGEGVMFGSFQIDGTAANQPALTKAFAEAKRPISLYAYTSYAAVQLITAAIRAAGTLESRRAGAELRRLSIQTAAGNIQFDKSGNAIGLRFQIFKWQNGAQISVQ
jgi:branched-chain amino acid transport system substrate-binding protein